MNDEKTTEIELPKHVNNIVRVNFSERRKATRPVPGPQAAQKPAAEITFHPTRDEWNTPWWVRLAALAAILVLSLFVL